MPWSQNGCEVGGYLRLDSYNTVYSGHLRSDFVVLLLLFTVRSRRTRKVDQKCPEKQDKKSKRDMKSIFLVEFSGNIGRNGFLTSIASQKIFRPYFQKSRLEYYFLCLFYFSSPYSGHLRSDFVVLLLLLTARCRRTRKADQKCPEKQDKKSKRDMKNHLSDLTIAIHMPSAFRKCIS